jgi:hypothetical protein
MQKPYSKVRLHAACAPATEYPEFHFMTARFFPACDLLKNASHAWYSPARHLVEAASSFPRARGLWNKWTPLF